MIFLPSILLGTFDAERIKQGYGVYIWMAAGSEEDETPVEKARYEGNYKDGLKHGVGKIIFPTGDIYEGEFYENKVIYYVIYYIMKFNHNFSFKEKELIPIRKLEIFIAVLG